MNTTNRTPRLFDFHIPTVFGVTANVSMCWDHTEGKHEITISSTYPYSAGEVKLLLSHDELTDLTIYLSGDDPDARHRDV